MQNYISGRGFLGKVKKRDEIFRMIGKGCAQRSDVKSVAELISGLAKNGKDQG